MLPVLRHYSCSWKDRLLFKAAPGDHSGVRVAGLLEMMQGRFVLLWHKGQASLPELRTRILNSLLNSQCAGVVSRNVGGRGLLHESEL